ncbi:MAG: AAA family ATPase [Clostridia bacterium]|nr:AAA family ATPase [Clostridia bacterium]
MKEFEKIIGYEAIKRELIQISDVLANNEVYKKLGVTSPRGLLLHGDPGVGKTLMSSAVIAESGRKAFICRKDKPNGDFIKAIKKTFTDAKAAAPSIVFLDDMDKFTNGDDRHPDAEEYVTVQSCIDDIKGKEVFVLATANSLRALPRSLLRAGRFDRVIEVNNPRGEDAVKIINHYIKNKKFVGDIDAAVVAKIMDDRSCAELETVINEAGLYAGFERSDAITMEHFMKACLHTVYDVPNEVMNVAAPKTDLSNGKDKRARIVYHEAGHATVAEVLDPGTVTLISAYSSEGQSSGFTSYYRSNARHSTETRYAHICGSLGGIAALEQKYGIVDVGSSNDLDHAFGSVWDLVTENCVCGFSLHSNGFDDSSELRSKQEQAVSSELERWYRKTKEILSVNHDLFESIASELSEKGILTAADIGRIKHSCRVIPVVI